MHINTYNNVYITQHGAKVGLQLCDTIYSSIIFIHYCIIFHMNSSKLTFAPPCSYMNILYTNMHMHAYICANMHTYKFI